MVKLKNRRLTLADVNASTARRAAVSCLGKWYAAASANAERQIRSLQVDENLATVLHVVFFSLTCTRMERIAFVSHALLKNSKAILEYRCVLSIVDYWCRFVTTCQ